MRVTLDLSRLASRVGRGVATGIDRVERSYLEWALSQDGAFFVVRTGRGLAGLDAAGAQRLLALLAGAPPRGDLLSRMRGDAVAADLRRAAVVRAPRGLPGRVLRAMPRPGVYLNVGHAHLTPGILGRLPPGVLGAVFLHDTIPLDVPQYNRPEMVARFGRLMARVAADAGHLIVNSRATAGRVAAHWPGGPLPPLTVAHLGVDVSLRAPGRVAPGAAYANAGSRPAAPGLGPMAAAPYFVAVGTLEGRKNHALLLDVWERLAQAMGARVPVLHLVGRRGWRNEGFFARFDASPLRDTAVLERGPLPDGEMRALVAGAAALLFPSFAEGYGLPPAEAAALGVLPICADLPVLREILSDHAVYLTPHDPYPWVETIKQRLDGRLDASRVRGFAPPTWARHFEIVEAALRRTMDERAGR